MCTQYTKPPEAKSLFPFLEDMPDPVEEEQEDQTMDDETIFHQVTSSFTTK